MIKLISEEEAIIIKAKEWLIEHKKQIAITVGVAGGLIVLAYLVGDSNGVKKIAEKTEIPKVGVDLKPITEESVDEIVKTARDYSKTSPFEVDTHIRKLHEGHKASLEKLEQAAQLGIDLKDGETIVDSYMKHAS